MNNAELIAALRYCGGEEKYCKLCRNDGCRADSRVYRRRGREDTSAGDGQAGDAADMGGVLRQVHLMGGRQMTQTERVHQYMRDFGSITQLDAIRDLGVMRLASRINDMKRQGAATEGV